MGVRHELTGEARVLDFADRMRRSGSADGISAVRLYHEAVEAFRRGEIGFDLVTPLYRHACIHAGVVRPQERSRYLRCPECDAQLDLPSDN